MNFQNLKRLKNHEDGSDFDDFWTESIASAQTFFPQIFARTKNKFAATKKFRDARTIERTRCQKLSGKRRNRIVIDGYKIDAITCHFRRWYLSSLVTLLQMERATTKKDANESDIVSSES